MKRIQTQPVMMVAAMVAAVAAVWHGVVVLKMAVIDSLKPTTGIQVVQINFANCNNIIDCAIIDLSWVTPQAIILCLSWTNWTIFACCLSVQLSIAA